MKGTTGPGTMGTIQGGDRDDVDEDDIGRDGDEEDNA